MSGFNMPPGVSPHDIPGNERPRPQRRTYADLAALVLRVRTERDQARGALAGLLLTFDPALSLSRDECARSLAHARRIMDKDATS